MVMADKGGPMNVPAILFGSLGSLLFLAGMLRWILSAPNDIINIHDTYFVLSPLILPWWTASFCLLIAATYFFFHLIIGRHVNGRLGLIHFGFSVIAIASVLLPFINLSSSFSEKPRRYYSYTDIDIHESVIDLWTIVAVMMFIGLIGQAIFLFNITRSLVRGQRQENS